MSSTRTRAWLALAAVATSGLACGSRTSTDRVKVDDVAADQIQVPREELTRDLEATVMEAYSHVSLGNFPSFRDTLAREVPIALIGVTPESTVTAFRQARRLRNNRVFNRYHPTLLAKNLELQLSDDGSVGWVFDEMSYRFRIDERLASAPIRQTSVYVRDLDRWLLVQAHESYPVEIESLQDMSASGQLPMPASLGGGKNSPSSSALIALLGNVLNRRPSSGPPRFADRSLILLPDRDHELRDAKASQAPSLATLFGPGTTVGIRDYRVQVSKSQQVAWMVSNLVVKTQLNGDAIEVNLRGSYVFTRKADRWALAQMHLSAPWKEAALEVHLFGE